MMSVFIILVPFDGCFCLLLTHKMHLCILCHIRLALSEVYFLKVIQF